MMKSESEVKANKTEATPKVPKDYDNCKPSFKCFNRIFQ